MIRLPVLQKFLILADETSDPETLAWDLMAQSEHDADASSVLISTSLHVTESVKEIINKEIFELDRASYLSSHVCEWPLYKY